MSSDLDTLQEFGFTLPKAQKALRKTRNTGLQAALDWLEQNPDDDGEADDGDDVDMDAGKDDEAKVVDETAATAKSLRCADCGKVFRDQATASFHGEKSGHQNFEESSEEIKPLTEEEKKQKLEELRAKLAEKRAKQSTVDAEEAKRNELIRRKGGKEQAAFQEEAQKKKAIADAEKAQREKVEDAKAKARIKAEIEADKKARAEKAAKEKAEREGRPTETVTTTKQAPTSMSSSSSRPKTDHKETRLQIRLPSGVGDGQPIVTTRESESSLKSLAEWVQQQTGLGSIKFSIPFPRKTFSEEEMNKSLKELDLVPSSVVIVST